MSSDHEKDPFLDQAKQAFDDSVTHMDAPTLSRLNQARQQALDAAGDTSQGRSLSWSNWMPVGGMATAALVATVWVYQDNSVVSDDILLSEAEEIELVEELDLMEEIEFVSWLVEVEANENAG